MKKHILIPYGKYQSLLQRANIPTPSTNIDPSADIPSPSANIPPCIDGMSVDDIIGIMPKNAQKKASSLLQLIQDHVNWNERCELVVGDEPIPNSHISDLVRYTVVRHFSNKRPPIGSAEFFAILKRLNIPRSLIVNTPQAEEPSPSSWYSLD